MAASPGTIATRQKVRLTILFLMVLTFPILMNYMSVFLIIEGSSHGILTFSFFFWSAWAVSALLLGRAACGWMCPLGAYQETKDRMAPKRLGKIKGMKWVKYFFTLAWMGAIAYSASAAGGYQSVDLMYFTESGVSVANPQSWFTWGTIVLVILLPAFLIGKRGFCHYFCPWGVINMTATRVKNFFGWHSLHLAAHTEKCKLCRTCLANCPMSLSVGDMMKAGSVKNDECILCGTCVDNCPNGAIIYGWSNNSPSRLSTLSGRRKNKRLKSGTRVLLSLLPAVLLGQGLTGCENSAVPPKTQPQTSLTSITLKGVGLSPMSNSADDFTGFFQKAKEAGNLVMWAGDWNDFNKDNGGPAVVADLASRYGYIPVVEAQFFSQSTGKLLRPMDESTKQLYKNVAANFSRKHKLKYFGLGIEVNVLNEKSPDDFQAFTQFFGEVYDAIKAASPDTKVFTVFQLEKVKGLNGGLFGGTNDPSKAEWDLLDKFPKADLFAFTTYPGLIYKDPAEIPDDYYSEIRQHTAKPVAFTEIGWHNEASPTGWESSEEEQARFIERFFSLTKNLKPSLTIWSFLYDQQTAEPFRSMGMLAGDGIAKEAWEAWGEANENSKTLTAK